MGSAAVQGCGLQLWLAGLGWMSCQHLQNLKLKRRMDVLCNAQDAQRHGDAKGPDGRGVCAPQQHVELQEHGKRGLRALDGLSSGLGHRGFGVES